MYIPHSFRFKDDQEMIRFMQKYSFATIITCLEDIPLASHLPFLVTTSKGKLQLSSHFALANEQAKHILNHTSLIIFTGPHAYISPQHYHRKEHVPTWDYIAVHAYGKARVLEEEAPKAKLLAGMIQQFEQGYMQQWKELSNTFKLNMMRGIVAFEIEVTHLAGQKKLSQNKSIEERERIITHLENSSAETEKNLDPFIRDTLH